MFISLLHSGNMVFPTSNYMFKVSNKDPFLMTCIGYKLTMKTPERHC